jgi:hypothetical protein
MAWVPVISGVIHKPVHTNVLPRVGESVRLPIREKDWDADSETEKVFRVVDVRHYIAYRETPSFEDVHLEEIK